MEFQGVERKENKTGKFQGIMKILMEFQGVERKEKNWKMISA